MHVLQLEAQAKDRKERLTSTEGGVSEGSIRTSAHTMFGVTGGTGEVFLVAGGTSIAVEGLRGSAGGTGRVTLLTRGSFEEEVGSVI